MKTVRAVINLFLIIFVLSVTSCQTSATSDARDTTRAYNPSGITPR